MTARFPRALRRRPAGALVAALLAVLLAPGPIRAQDLGVHEALRRAEAEHPALGAIAAQLAVDEGRWAQGFGLYAPTLSYAREGIEGGAYAEQRFVLTQVVDAPLESYYRLRRLRTEQDATRLEAVALRAEIRARVKAAYLALQYADEVVRLRVEGLDLARRLLEAARLRASVGEAAGLETLRAELAVAEAEAAHAEAVRDREAAAVAAVAAAGLDASASVTPKGPGPLAYASVSVAREEVLGALEALPSVGQAARRVDAAALGLRQTRAALLPGLQFEVFPQDFGGGFERFGFQVGLRLPLWLVPNHRGARQEAAAVLQQRRFAQQDAHLRAAADAEAAWAAYAASRAAAERHRAVTAPQAEELLRLTERGYRAGELALLSLLEAQQAYLAVQERHARTLRTYYDSLIHLERFVGRDLVFVAPLAPTAAR